ncbi:ACP S-malonyltransferase [Buchnera aphidicola]|uniref:ACP S-malonyltransferase n=1 Tax=Buchnera aphidicola TaxID=9 RepID=UPI0031B804F3
MSYALIFNGQEKIKLNFLKKIFNKNKIIKKLFDETSEYIKYNIWKNIIDNNNDIFIIKNNIQPILLTISVAIFNIFIKYNPLPKLSAGNSLGEYSALVCSKSIKFSNAIKILILRSKYMKESVLKKKTFMILIQGINIYILKKICKYIKQKKIYISISNFNTNKQFVITGYKKNIKKIIKYLKKINYKFIYKLPILTSSHCLLMKKSSKKFYFALKKIKIKKPIFPIINNINVKYEFSSEKIKKSLKKQLYKPVRWKEILDYIKSKKIKNLFKIGYKKKIKKKKIKNLLH